MTQKSNESSPAKPEEGGLPRGCKMLCKSRYASDEDCEACELPEGLVCKEYEAQSKAEIARLNASPENGAAGVSCNEKLRANRAHVMLTGSLNGLPYPKPTSAPASEPRMRCPYCKSGLLWSEDRGAHCDGCDEYDEALSQRASEPGVETPGAKPTTAEDWKEMTDAEMWKARWERQLFLATKAQADLTASQATVVAMTKDFRRLIDVKDRLVKDCRANKAEADELRATVARLQAACDKYSEVETLRENTVARLEGALKRLLGPEKCPECSGWGEVSYMGEMANCRCAGKFRYTPNDEDIRIARASLKQEGRGA